MSIEQITPATEVPATTSLKRAVLYASLRPVRQARMARPRATRSRRSALPASGKLKSLVPRLSKSSSTLTPQPGQQTVRDSRRCSPTSSRETSTTCWCTSSTDWPATVLMTSHSEALSLATDDHPPRFCGPGKPHISILP